MTVALQPITPESNSLIAPSDTDISISVTDTGADPARVLNVSVNAALIFTRLAAVTTFLDAGYTVSVATPEPNVTVYTLTKTTPWPDPSGVDVNTTYQADPAAPVITKNSTAIAGAFQVVPATPYSGQPDAPPRTSISLSMGQPSGPDIAGFTVSINDAVALVFQPGAPVWSLPDYYGAVNYTAQSATVFIDPRRYFNYDFPVQVTINASLAVGLSVAAVTRTYKFYVAPRLSRAASPELQYSRVDQLFENSPAIETLRYALKGALQTRPSAAPYLVLLYARILRSSLKSVASIFNRSDLTPLAEALVPEDLVDPTAALVPLTPFEILWAPAVSESKEIGITEDTLGLIEKAYASPYPQEKLGAIAGLVLLNANART
jgi:hypothetical protein